MAGQVRKFRPTLAKNNTLICIIQKFVQDARKSVSVRYRYASKSYIDRWCTCCQPLDKFCIRFLVPASDSLGLRNSKKTSQLNFIRPIIRAGNKRGAECIKIEYLLCIHFFLDRGF